MVNITGLLTLRNIKKAFFTVRREGFSALLDKINREIKLFKEYSLWIKQNQEKSIAYQKDIKFSYTPKISIITATYNPPLDILKSTILSVLGQTYSNWELCIADGKSSPGVCKMLEEFRSKDSRIKVIFLEENKGIAGNFNEGISLATGDYISFLDHDDMLSLNALFEVVRKINANPEAEIIYSDEDIMDSRGKRIRPLFKPDWSPDYLRSCNYICHFLVIKKTLLDEIGYFRNGFDGSQDYDLVLRLTEKSEKILHIPKVLYHWRYSPGSVLVSETSKPLAWENGKKALEEHIMRTGQEGRVEYGRGLYTYRVIYKIKGTPEVSIIIPNTNNKKGLEKCINSILVKSTYKNYDIIIGENNSSEEEILSYYRQLENKGNIKIVIWDKPFNHSGINNLCARHTNAPFLLFINNNTEVITPSWIENMLEHCQRKETGAVGAKLYYPDGKIQHAGIIIQGCGPVYAFEGFNGNSKGYMSRAVLIQNYSAVSGACLLTRKEVFEEVGGFDENLASAYNDVDYCIKLREKGYLIVWTPYSELFHYEKKTRTGDITRKKTDILKKELEYLKNKWKNIFDRTDPYYNPNLHSEKGNFALNIK
ncbi:MAG TPA: glycosyltransferase family 2 protein [bacterium]|nr:glycosyltransferase family 2 protein [bacterium]